MDNKAKHPSEVWASGDAYEPYVGRWSRLVAQEFLRWLDIPPQSCWLDVGCGTGALSQTILKQASPREVKGLDRSAGYIAYAQGQVNDKRISFQTADAQMLPLKPDSYDAAVSGLVLNFIPEPGKAIAEMMRVTRPGGTVAAYVWDYAEGIQLMRYFWDAVVALDPTAHNVDEGQRFPICNPGPLGELFSTMGLRNTEVRAIVVPTDFRDFDDYWSPFLGGQGAAPSYAMSMNEERRAALREQIHTQLPIAPNGSIHLTARAWAVRGIV